MVSIRSSNPERLLRVAVSHHGRIIEERLFRGRETVTVGAEPRNTLVLPTPAGATARLAFEQGPSGCRLRFDGSVSGRVAREGAPLELAALRCADEVRREQDGYVVPLPPTAKGAIAFGECVVLFQFLPKRPERPHHGLSPRARNRTRRRADSSFAGVLVGVLLFNYGSVTALTWGELPASPEPTLEELPQRVITGLLPFKAKPPPEPKKQQPARAAHGPVAPQDGRRLQPATKVARPAPTVIDRKEMEARVKSASILRYLGSTNPDGVPSAIRDVLSDGVDPTGVEQALQGIDPRFVTAATERLDETARKGSGPGDRLAIDIGSPNPGLPAADRVLAEKRSTVITARVTDSVEDLETGSCDRGTIARSVKQRLRAIQACYERELKRDPGLKGKLVVRFLIGPDGRASEVEIEESDLRNPDVSACVRNTIRAWYFPIHDQECPVSYPFLFVPGA